MPGDEATHGIAAGLVQADALEQEGRLVEAAQTYRQVLERSPEDHEALFRLGRAMGRMGQTDLALALIGQAAARAPDNVTYHRWLGELLLAAGHAQDAADAFREVLRLEPASADGRLGLAEAFLDLGAEAEARALAGSSDLAGDRALRVRGRLRLGAGNPAGAADDFLEHLRRQPHDASAYFYLGVALQQQDFLEPAVASYREALSRDASLFEAHTNLSTALVAMGHTTDAVLHADVAVSLAPGRAGLYLNRANARRAAGDQEGAGDDYRVAVGMDPSYAEAWSSLANLLHDQGEWAAALAAHDRAVELAPTVPQMRWNRSFSRLARGQLGAGWDDYESRLATKAARPEPRDFPWPAWAGEPLEGRRVLVWREQGVGDEVQFATCVPDLVAAGARVSLLASPRLVSLFRRSLPGVEVVTDVPGAVPSDAGFHFQIPLGSLPRWLRRDRASFPGTRLLEPDPAQVAKWGSRLAALGPGRKVGFCWRSGLITPERRRHYPPLDAWGPALAAPGVIWVNLQYDECAEDLESLEGQFGVRIHRWPEENLRDDLESVTGLVAALDAVVSAPTAVASLSGAAGTPTWVVDAGADWTVFGGHVSPWFPDVRMARRSPDTSDWELVMLRVAQGLSRLAPARSGPGEGS